MKTINYGTETVERLPWVYESNGESLTKKEYEAYSKLRDEHNNKTTFTRFYEDGEGEESMICSPIMMNRLVFKGIIQAIPRKAGYNQKQFYKWSPIGDDKQK